MLSDTSHQPLTGAANLKNPDLGAVWRSALGVDDAAVIVDFGASVSIAGVVLAEFSGPASSTFRVRLATADATGEAGDAYDSGALSGVFQPAFRHFVHFLLAGDSLQPATGRYLRIEADTGTGASLQAGYLMAGPVWSLTHNFRKGAERRLEDANEVVRARSGQRWTSLGGRWRRWRGTLPWVTDAEAVAQLEPLARRTADGLPILFCEDPAAAALGPVSWLGHLAPASWTRSGHDRHEFPFDLTELV